MTTVISPNALFEKLQSNTLEGSLIDVRDADEYQREHIAGSQNIPLESLHQRAEQLQHLAKPLIVSCQSGRRAELAAAQLHALNLKEVVLLQGSLNGWKKSGLPTEKQGVQLSLMRQVMIIAGSLILLGLSLPTLGWLPWLVGAGLTFAGLTNICPMAIVLSKMSWNRLKPKDNPMPTSCCSR